MFCVELLTSLALPAAWAQSVTPTFSSTRTPTPTFTSTFTAVNTDTPTDTPTVTPSPTFTFNPFATPTWTFTWDPYATDTPTVGSPTATFTVTPTSTPTQTGTISPSMTFTPTLTSTPSISRSTLALWPTAFSDGWDRSDGFNWDLGFTYFIGSIAERDYSQKNVDWLNPLRLWLLTSDVKYAWLDEDGDMPGMASGVMLSELINGGGNPGATGTNAQSFQLTGNSMGGVYTVMSKTIAKNNAVHFGYVYNFGRLFNQLGIGSFGPDLSYAQLIPMTSQKLSGIMGAENANIFYTGFNTRLLGTNVKFEVWKPFPMEQDPVLLDTQIDGLFAFNLGYERWDNGYAVLGYFNFRFTIVPVPPAY